MFVQVIQGRTSDPAALRSALDRYAGLSPGAVDVLGATAGVTADGRFVEVVRFTSADAAARHDARPEQQEWWAQTASLLDGDVVRHESDQVDVDLVGDPDQAGFVQVMQGRTTDPRRARELASGNAAEWAAFRPDILGSVTIDHGDGGWTSVVYFTSEAAAREGERKEPPPVVAAQMADLAALTDGPVEYLDLADPWLYAPG